MTDPDPSSAPTHVLMTRFNLATPGREADIRNRPDWLATRFDLFEAYCLPSVARQTTRDFVWIIYFDKDTPQVFKDRIAELQREFPFEAYYTGLFPGSGWPRSVAEVLGGMPHLLLTSRLDNDDALAFDYMERTQAAAIPPGEAPRTGIVITNGFIRAGARAYRIGHPCNAFTSWLEQTEALDEVRTCMGIVHMDAAAFGPLRQVPGPGGWMQVVHGGNVSNKVRGQRVAPAALDGRFPPQILEGLESVSDLRVAAENALVSPLRNSRDDLVALLRRFRG